MSVKNKLKSLTQNFCENSGYYASRAYAAATAWLLVKGTVVPVTEHHFDLQTLNNQANICDITSALLFFGSSYCYHRAQDDPKFWQYAGPFVAAAGVTLVAGGWRGDASDMSFWLQAASMAPTIFAGICFTFNKRGLGAFPELASRVPHAIAGVMQADPGQIFFAAACMTGDAAVLVSDPKVKEKIMER